MYREYDVFISYNSEDESEAFELNRLLVEQIGLKTWFDQESIDGRGFMLNNIEDGLAHSLACVILVGKSGFGKWQQAEIQVALHREIEQPTFRVVVVILASAISEPDWSSFLKEKARIDLRKNSFGGLRKLLYAIRGIPTLSIYSLSNKTDSVQFLEDDDIEEPIVRGYSAEVTKIVGLLIGESLYSRKDVCVRELVQNSVDACERRRVKTRGYKPEIVLRINTRDGWFEVDDNGEGMNQYLLKNSFSVLGKSIRDEKNIENLLNEHRLNLIAKFGIGFVSAFMLSEHVVISTTYAGTEQINFTIQKYTEPFSYPNPNVSECSRDPLKVGSTIRVYLKPEFRSIDIAGIAKIFLRHVSDCRVVKDDEEVQLIDDWNIGGAVIVQNVPREQGKYELKWGASNNEGSLIASNWGFYIGEETNPILPFFTPRWMVGEIDFLPGIVDLTVARDKVVNNEKAQAIQMEMKKNLRKFLRELPEKLTKAYSSETISERKHRISAVESRLKDLYFIYNYCWRNPNPNPDEWEGEPPLTLEETDKLILETLYFGYGKDEQGMERHRPLGEILQELRRLGLSKIYKHYSGGSDPVENILADYLKATGNLVFYLGVIKTYFHGYKKGAIEVWSGDHYVLTPLLKSHGFEIVELRSVNPHDIAGLKVNLGDLPQTIIPTLQAEINSGTKLVVINLPKGDIVLHKKDTWYLNIANPLFDEIIKRSKVTSVNEYIKGLLHSKPL